MDINIIKKDSGKVFNKNDPRFESVVNNHVNNNTKRLINCVCDNSLFEHFASMIYTIANYCFFIQIGEIMYACGIENCSIDVLFENDNEVNCALKCSFHLYSSECGFYKIDDFYVAQKRIMKTFSIDNGEMTLTTEISKKQMIGSNLSCFYFEKNGELESINWKEVYDCSQLSVVYVKTCEIDSGSGEDAYSIIVLKNNKCFQRIDNIKNIFIGYAMPSIVGYIKKSNEMWEFYDYFQKRIKYTLDNSDYIKSVLETGFGKNEESLRFLLLCQNEMPMLKIPLIDVVQIINRIEKCLKSDELYMTENIKNFETVKFEFTFTSYFDKISDIAVIYASQFETFKKLSSDMYYVSFDAIQIQHIEMMYFILRKMKYAFDKKTMEYVNSVSVLKILENLIEIWQFMKETAINTNDVLLINEFSDGKHDLLRKTYRELYNKQIKAKRNEIFNMAVSNGFKFNNRSSEMQLFALISKHFDDAIYQYRNKWLGKQSLDIYIPSLKIAFEYQGEQHYYAIDFFGGETALKQNQERDAKKKRLCASNGIKLIEWRYDEKINEENLRKKLQPFTGELT